MKIRKSLLAGLIGSATLAGLAVATLPPSRDKPVLEQILSQETSTVHTDPNYQISSGEVRSPRAISQYGINLIKKYEGFRAKKYDPIPNDNKVEWTIGYGHLIKPGEELEAITSAQAEELLRSDILWAEKTINDNIKVELAQHQYDALCSFVYNVGPKAFKDSTLLRKLNDKDYTGAANEFPRWKKSSGKVLNGLIKRRAEERKLFLNEN